MQEEPLGEHRLRDGTRVRVRTLEPRDVGTVEDALRGLAPVRRRSLREAGAPIGAHELRRRMARADEAPLLGALHLDADGWECECLAIAGYALDPDEHEVARPVLASFDPGRGLGRLLAEHLVQFAAARGVKSFRTVMADEHRWLRERIARCYPTAEITRLGACLAVDVALPALAAPGLALERSRGAAPDPRWRLLRWVAEGSVKPRRPGRLAAWLEAVRRQMVRLRPAAATH